MLKHTIFIFTANLSAFVSSSLYILAYFLWYFGNQLNIRLVGMDMVDLYSQGFFGVDFTSVRILFLKPPWTGTPPAKVSIILATCWASQLLMFSFLSHCCPVLHQNSWIKTNFMRVSLEALDIRDEESWAT